MPTHQARPNGRRRQDPLALGLFEKRFDGDDALLGLARMRFFQSGMGAEMHAGTVDHLNELLRFRPWPEAPVIVHLPRDFSLAREPSRRAVVELAGGCAGRVHGLVLHDQADLATRPQDFVEGAQALESALEPVAGAPLVFLEYAAGLDPTAFTQFFETIRGLRRTSACIDIGHVGIRQARLAYSEVHPGEDLCALKTRPARLPEVIADVVAAAAKALPSVLALVQALGSFAKPLHFHLHDGHPLSTSSPFGVSDHLSFLSEIPLSLPYAGKNVLPLMFGPAGLRQIVSAAIGSLGDAGISFTLEIHPTFERLPLGDATPLFCRWTDTTHAEQMNHWLEVLSRNHGLLMDAIRAAQAVAF